jgi:hypothetical protein
MVCDLLPLLIVIVPMDVCSVLSIETQMLLLASAMVNTVQRIFTLMFDLVPLGLVLLCFLGSELFKFIKHLHGKNKERKAELRGEEDEDEDEKGNATGKHRPVPLDGLDKELDVAVVAGEKKDSMLVPSVAAVSQTPLDTIQLDEYLVVTAATDQRMRAAVLQARIVEVDTAPPPHPPPPPPPHPPPHPHPHPPPHPPPPPPAAAAAAEARQAGEKVDTDERYYKYLGHSDTMEAAIADWHTAVNTPAAAGTSCSAEND